jgi:hypothetical protein
MSYSFGSILREILYPVNTIITLRSLIESTSTFSPWYYCWTAQAVENKPECATCSEKVTA